MLQVLIGMWIGSSMAVVGCAAWWLTREEHKPTELDELRRFIERLEAGETIHCAVMTVEQTPDGPLTTVETTTLDEHLRRLSQ